MVETKHTIDDIAEQLDRLCPSQVDKTPRSFGQGYDSGHIGHDHDDEDPVVGWFTDAGNTGNPVFSLPRERIDEMHAVLAARPDLDLDLDTNDLDQIVRDCGGKWLA
jgi:hypothetical protein